MSKIAICFLVTKNIVNIDVWDKWIDPKKCNIYSHFSQIGTITQQILLNNRVNPVPTKWGDISLVYAEGELYKEAFKNKQNKFFILVSDTCIPVRSFKYLYNRLFKNTKKGILGYRLIGNYKDDPEPFIKDGKCDSLLKKYRFYSNKVYAADQWKILTRSNVRNFIQMLGDPDLNKLFTDCIRIVPDSLAPDELMYVNWMNKKVKGKLKDHFRAGGPTFVDFKGKAIHPVNFVQMPKGLADDICYSNTLFARKFPEPIENRLIKQLPITCYKKRSLKRGTKAGSIMR